MFSLFNKNDFKRFLCFAFVFIFVFVCLFGFMLLCLHNFYIDVVNSTVSSIIDNVHEYYPDVPEEELIRVINGKSSNSSLSSVLEKYGYGSSSSEADSIVSNKYNFAYISKLQNCMNYGFFIECCFFIVFCFFCLFVLFVFKKNEYKNIDELYCYFNDLNNKFYDLKISDNRDDEFSKLRNELYKTTVLMKSIAESSQLEKVNLSNSLADISHQLKTPITSIRILLDNVCNDPDMDIATRKEFLQDISMQIDWISSLIVSLLKLAKFDSGIIVMNNDFIELNSLFDDVVSGLAILMDLRDVHVVRNIPDNCVIFADYKWIFEAFSNIIKNCIEHSFAGSHICIDVIDSSLFVKVVIKDFGSGIAKEDLKHIFERFYKGKNSSPDSIGIGLSLAKSIIEQENGYITVDSQLGNGSTFEIKFLKSY